MEEKKEEDYKEKEEWERWKRKSYSISVASSSNQLEF